jgi:hypothetical protein
VADFLAGAVAPEARDEALPDVALFETNLPELALFALVVFETVLLPEGLFLSAGTRTV